MCDVSALMDCSKVGEGGGMSGIAAEQTSPHVIGGVFLMRMQAM